MRFLFLIRTWLICLALAGAAAFFAYQTVTVWFAKGNPGVHQPVRESSKTPAPRRAAIRRNPPYRTFEVIAQKNLFASDRREKLSTNAPVRSRSRPPRALDRRFALYGIVIDGEEKRALVSNLNKKNALGKAYIWVKIGDKVGNLHVSDITPDQVVMTDKGNAHIIRLSDQNHPQKRSIMRNAIKQTGTGTKTIKKPKVVRPVKKKPDGSS